MAEQRLGARVPEHHPVVAVDHEEAVGGARHRPQQPLGRRLGLCQRVLGGGAAQPGERPAQFHQGDARQRIAAPARVALTGCAGDQARLAQQPEVVGEQIGREIEIGRQFPGGSLALS